MSTIVHIAETAFISILVSAIESFPSKYAGRKKPKNALPEGEVYGLLFGQRISKGGNTIFHASIATPMHILSVKTPGKVSPSVRHFERIRTVIEAFPMYQFLGTFHSHPKRKGSYRGIASSFISAVDERSALGDAASFGDEIVEVIVGLTYLDKVMKKNAPDTRWSFTQNYCGNYKYSLSAYVTNMASCKVDLADNLICPLAAGVGNYDLNP